MIDSRVGEFYAKVFVADPLVCAEKASRNDSIAAISKAVGIEKAVPATEPAPVPPHVIQS